MVRHSNDIALYKFPISIYLSIYLMAELDPVGVKNVLVNLEINIVQVTIFIVNCCV